MFLHQLIQFCTLNCFCKCVLSFLSVSLVKIEWRFVFENILSEILLVLNLSQVLPELSFNFTVPLQCAKVWQDLFSAVWEELLLLQLRHLLCVVHAVIAAKLRGAKDICQAGIQISMLKSCTGRLDVSSAAHALSPSEFCRGPECGPTRHIST